MDRIIPKGAEFYKNMSISQKDLKTQLEKEDRGIKCQIKQIIDKRKEIIKRNQRNHEIEMKNKVQIEHKVKLLQSQAEKAEKIKHEIEVKTSEKVEKKLEKRKKAVEEGQQDFSPYFDQYNNLNYVPKPPEYFKISAKNQIIKQQLDLSKNKLTVLKEKQLKEMGHMMDYEINLQHIKKKNEDMLKSKEKMHNSMAKFKQVRYQQHVELMNEINKKIGQQKKLDEEIRMENKKRMFMVNQREMEAKLRKIKEHEMKAKVMKQSEEDYEQNRRFMIKQLVGDFKELKQGHITADDISGRYAYLRDEETFNKAMAELNKRRHLSKQKLVTVRKGS